MMYRFFNTKFMYTFLLKRLDAVCVLILYANHRVVYSMHILPFPIVETSYETG